MLFCKNQGNLQYFFTLSFKHLKFWWLVNLKSSILFGRVLFEGLNNRSDVTGNMLNFRSKLDILFFTMAEAMAIFIALAAVFNKASFLNHLMKQTPRHH